MKPQELRIDNLLMNRHTGLWCKVSFMQRDLPLLWLTPIPLTAEILTASGFEREGMAFVLYHVKICLWPMGDVFEFEYDINSNITIQYVHQLQNLHYALFGEELEIKQPV